MPIHTLFARGVRYPRLGIIRLGISVDTGRVKNGEPVFLPKEVSYFVLPPELAAVSKIGDKPTRLDVSFPSDDPAKVCDPWMIRYDGPLLAAKCDGVTCTLIPKEGPETTFACARPKDGPAKCPKCGATALARLNVIPRYAPVLGVYQVLIGGISRIESVLTELHLYARAGLSRNWFILDREEQEVQIRTDEGKRLARTGWPVHVRFQASPDQVLGPGMARLELAAGTVDADDDPAPDVPDDDVEWDISLCFAKVNGFGIDEKTYTAYLAGVYRGGVDNMTATQLGEQESMIKAALGNEQKRAEFVAAVRKVASSGVVKR